MISHSLCLRYALPLQVGVRRSVLERLRAECKRDAWAHRVGAITELSLSDCEYEKINKSITNAATAHESTGSESEGCKVLPGQFKRKLVSDSFFLVRGSFRRFGFLMAAKDCSI